MYQNDAQKVLTGEVCLSYCNLIQPRAPLSGQGDPKYSVTILIPKTDVATKADIDASIEAAARDAVGKLWGGVRPRFDSIVWDGDGTRKNGLPFGSECKGHWVLTASTKQKPQVVGIDNINAELAPQDIYSGMYGRVTLRFFGYSQSGNRGVGCGLGNVLKTRFLALSISVPPSPLKKTTPDGIGANEKGSASCLRRMRNPFHSP